MPIRAPTITAEEWHRRRAAKIVDLSAIASEPAPRRRDRRPRSIDLVDAIRIAEKAFCESGENGMLAATLAWSGVSAGDLRAGRSRACVSVRRAMIWCLRLHLPWSGSKIARFLGIRRSMVPAAISVVSRKTGVPTPANGWAMYCNDLDDEQTQESTIQTIFSLIRPTFGMSSKSLVENRSRRTPRFTEARMCVIYAMRKNRVSLRNAASAMQIAYESTISTLVTKLAGMVESDQTLADQLRQFMEKIKVALDRK